MGSLSLKRAKKRLRKFYIQDKKASPHCQTSNTNVYRIDILIDILIDEYDIRNVI